MKFSIKDFFSKCDQIRRNPWSPFNKRFKNPNSRKINIKGTMSNTKFK